MLTNLVASARVAWVAVAWNAIAWGHLPGPLPGAIAWGLLPSGVPTLRVPTLRAVALVLP